MKKFTNYITALISSAILLVAGCATINALSPAQVAVIGSVLTATADGGALYAIQQDAKNANYFKIADLALDNFATGKDLSPTALETALSAVTTTNQWVNLAISGVVAAYDVSYSDYISGQLTNAPAARIWIIDVEAGFKQALAQTGTGLRATVAPLPWFYTKGINTTKGDMKAAFKARIKNALKK